MTESAIYRYEVPVDDQWHPFTLHDRILHVACNKPDVVEFWARHDFDVVAVDSTYMLAELRVLGTGQPFTDDGQAWYVGSAIYYVGANSPFATGQRLVWHLYQRRPA